MRLKKAISFVEIFLIISLSIATSYLISEADQNNNLQTNIKKNKLDILKAIGSVGRLVWDDNTLVSALNADDLKAGTWTCLESKDGGLCQEYVASECNDKCKTSCIPTNINNVEQCKLGTCVDGSNGGCETAVPKSLCENVGKSWFNDKFGNIPQCKPGCCILGGQSAWIPSSQCKVESERLGIEQDFRPTVTNELACIALKNSAVEGACLYGKDDQGKNQCKFTTEENCKNTIKGEFNPGKLCSNTALNTNCEKMKSTGCAIGKDEVYWFDSCGNRENIYSSGSGSWNNGSILSKENSCVLGTNSNPLLNSGSCGNCNMLAGSICGKSNSAAVGTPNFVCKDIGCVDKFGNKRANGESWCEYQGSVGNDKDVQGGRSSDTVGSRDFRKVCVKGEIVTEPCADYRNEICVESKNTIPESSKTFSTAACRINRWQECLSYNSNKEKKDKCTTNPDCFLKSVSVGDFKFDACAPKYAPGFLFDEDGRGEGGEALCKMGNIKCTKVMVKKISGWKCEAGCDCDTAKFTEQMNDFCTSIGDCGAKANYLGEESLSYSIKGAPKLRPAYLGKLINYANENNFKNVFADPGTPIQGGSINIPQGLGAEVPVSPGTDPNLINQFNMYAGLAGLAATGIVAGGTALGFMGGTAGLGVVGASTTFTSTIAPALGAFAGALAGAAAGVALVSMLLSATGVDRGLDPWMSYTLMGAGAVGGAIVGYTLLTTSGGLMAGLAAVPIVGWIILIVVVIIIIILTIIGVGDVKKIKISYTCKPWQAPAGGSDCGKCGSDGFPCSKYACSSLGQTCQIINEDSDSPECIDVGKGDVSPPVLAPWQGLLNINHNYTEINGNGFKIVGPGGCVSPYTQLVFGLQLNEPAICKASNIHTDSFDEMDLDFGVSQFYRRNLTHIIAVPPISSLGYVDILPNSTGNYDMYVRCQDKSGNKNVAEYKISFCIKKGLDLTPPVITSKEPTVNSLAFGEDNQNITLNLNEPAECRWDYSDKEYEMMNKNMVCDNSLENDMFEWKCYDNWKASSNQTTQFFVRCKDQPWLANKTVVKFTNSTTTLYIPGENKIIINSLVGGTKEILNETAISDVIGGNGMNLTQSRNTNKESKVFELRKTKYNLKIDSISPNKEIIEVSSLPATVEVNVKTSEGVNYGYSICSYSYNNGPYIPFADTFRNIHKQTFSSLVEGHVNIPVQCIDIAGNKAEGKIEFDVKADTESPKVLRVYSIGSSISLVTNEPSKCFYSNENCKFDIGNSTSLTSSYDTKHSFGSDVDKTYYIKCQDSFGNGPGSQCSVILKESRVGIAQQL